MPICVNCGSEFTGRRKDAVYCDRFCSSRVRQRRYRKANPKRSNVAWQRYALSVKGTTSLLLNYARDRSRVLEVPFELDREWLEAKLEVGVCELTGLPLERRCADPMRRAHPYKPSLDRKVPSLGYTKDNTRVVCFCVNRARADWGDDVMMSMATALVEKMSETEEDKRRKREEEERRRRESDALLNTIIYPTIYNTPDNSSCDSGSSSSDSGGGGCD